MPETQMDETQSRRDPETIIAGNAKAHGTHKNLLIIEDDSGIGEIILQIIQNETDHCGTLVSDAFHALQCLKTVKPHAILLDYQLPHMNGLQFYDQLHSMENYKDIPIVLMSANFPVEGIKERRLQTLKKPFELDDLVEVVHQCMRD